MADDASSDSAAAASAAAAAELGFDLDWLSHGTALVARGAAGQVLRCNDAFSKLASTGVGGHLWAALRVEAFEEASKVLPVRRGGADKLQEWVEVRTRVVRDGALLFVEATDRTKEKQADNMSTAFLELSFDGFFDWHIREDYEWVSSFS
jgi:hypothetical protein